MSSRMNDIVLLLGRLCIAALFLPGGIAKLTGFAGFAASPNIAALPFPMFFAAAAVAIEVLGPVALILGVWPRWTALALIAFTGMATVLAHKFWGLEGQPAMLQRIQFFKNLGIIGGLLFYFVSGSGAFAIRRLAGRP